MTRRVLIVVLVLTAAGAAVVVTRSVLATGPPPSPAPSPPNVMAASTARATSSGEPSDPGDAVSHHSARLEDVEPVDKPRPTRLRIDALDIDAPIVALGVAANGEMDVPADAGTAAWYEHGPSPGQDGSAVLAAHVDYNGRRGVFFNLSDLQAGATVTVEFADGPQRRFTVVDGASIAKAALPIDQLFRRDGEPALTLITCGGDFDPATRSYRSNVVVRTSPSVD
jgi:sortase (surface protein transpeptidase)